MSNKRAGRKKPDCQWFIEPLDAVANESLVREFPGADMESITDSDGEQHNVFRCNWDVVKRFLNAAPQILNPPKYKVYRKVGGGKSERVPFFEPKPKRKKTKGGAVTEEPPYPTDPDEGIF